MKTQDGLDFFLGNYVWDDNRRSPFQDSTQLKVRIIPILALVSFSMSIIGVLLPPSMTTLIMVIRFKLTIQAICLASKFYLLCFGWQLRLGQLRTCFDMAPTTSTSRCLFKRVIRIYDQNPSTVYNAVECAHIVFIENQEGYQTVHPLDNDDLYIIYACI